MICLRACTAALALALLQLGATAGDLHTKKLVFAEPCDSNRKADMAAHVVPTDAQRRWQDLELTAFLHFGMNTFTGREWGDGQENPDIFAPYSLDTDQWARVLKESGFKLAMLTAKHHDGFCLWPTATTPHSVASSSWRNGNGDVVREFVDAARRYGLKVGLYLSPWDRNAPCYGDSPAYNDMYEAQLTELLTRYGDIDEVWMDGACGEGPDGRTQEYDLPRFRETIAKLQPGAVVAIMGDDVRWVGNENGEGRTTEWSVTPLAPRTVQNADSLNAALGIDDLSPDLGSRTLLAGADRVYWWPSEVDVSIRRGWFWHPGEEPRSLESLKEIYLKSVGRNSVLLLNIPPDRHGRIDSRDAARLAEFGAWVRDSFGRDAVRTLPASVNAVVLREDITKGQRVEEFRVMGLADGEWKELAHGTTVGRKRIMSFPAVRLDDLRIEVLRHRGDSVHLLRPQPLYLE